MFTILRHFNFIYSSASSRCPLSLFRTPIWFLLPAFRRPERSSSPRRKRHRGRAEGFSRSIPLSFHVLWFPRKRKMIAFPRTWQSPAWRNSALPRTRPRQCLLRVWLQNSRLTVRRWKACLLRSREGVFPSPRRRAPFPACFSRLLPPSCRPHLRPRARRQTTLSAGGCWDFFHSRFYVCPAHILPAPQAPWETARRDKPS